MRRVEVGDIVRILTAPETVAAGYADRTGTCYGFTTPSMSGEDVIGSAVEDDALSIHFDDGSSAWFTRSLVAFVDVDSGQMMRIGEKWFVRTPDGDWIESPGPN
jgi:hypothetical protein